MVRNYKKKTSRGDWSDETMKNAVDAVMEGKMGYMLAAKTFSVPQTTLERKVKAARESADTNQSIEKFKVALGPKQRVFSDEEEQKLCEYLLEMESKLFGLTTKDLRGLVYRLAVKNNKAHPFNNEKQEAGKDWVQAFLKRHPELSIRQPECTSAARAAGFNNRSRTPEESVFLVASPQQIMPVPTTRKNSRASRKRGKTAIITSSPYKIDLEETIKKKKLAEEDKKRKKEIRELKKVQKIVPKKRVTNKKKASKKRSTTEKSDSDSENTPCLYCKGLYLESNEGWAACSACGKWAHCSCAGIDDEDADAVFKCEYCKQQ